ncbi:major facilitator superfamily transporter [Salmonella enterica subsp. enterica serovar Sanjuan]|uniref:Major facilitator superfamily transporter n=1 Tax=Salmonella enterica subsp. enterica serovar Sanjuan TaxID=1160765 RepID=A0A3S4GS60_SALET|nr:major facilitator superfamily transporter [Salmonella enterica subsp. enterica serovar Sanjuan]
MPEPVAEPALNGLRLNLRIVSIVMFNFASYLTIGLPLAVLPGYVHDAMGFSAFWAGLIISLQYFATLLSRPHAGRYADVLGPKKIVIFGLCGCFLSGLGYLLADIASAWPMISLLLLGLGRVILGIGAKFCRHRFDTVGHRRRRVVAYWSGHLLERYRHLRRNGDGRAAGRAVLCMGAGYRGWR